MNNTIKRIRYAFTVVLAVLIFIMLGQASELKAVPNPGAQTLPDYAITWEEGTDDATPERMGTYVDANGNTHSITFVRWDAPDSLPASAGSFYLANDVNISDTPWITRSDVALCLNGKSILLSGESGCISVTSDTTLELFDTRGDYGKITRIDDNKESGVIVNGKFVMYGGNICDNKGHKEDLYEYGGGIYVSLTGEFCMNGGIVENNNAYYGGGIYIKGKATMNGGVIRNNVATNKGGGIYLSVAEGDSSHYFRMTDGTITDDFECSDNNAYVTVTFYPGEGTGEIRKQYILKEGVAVQLIANVFASPSGKKFAGWRGTFSKLWLADKQEIYLSNDLMLDAQWIPVDEEIPSGEPTPSDIANILSKYTEYKDMLQEIVDNLDAYLNAMRNTPGYNTQDYSDCVTRRETFVSLMGEADNAIAALRSYFDGETSEPVLFTNLNAALSKNNLGVIYGDPTGATRDCDIIVAQYKFSVKNARLAVQNRDLNLALLALLSYIDAEETLFKYMDAGGFTGAKELLTKYDSYFKDADQSVFDNFEAEDFSNIYTGVWKNMPPYYEWLLTHYMLGDYADYLLKKETGRAGTQDTWNEINKFSLNSIYYARKIIYDELMPVLFVSPNKLVYTGSDQPLVNESEWVSGMIKYLLGDARKWFLTENDRYYDLIDYFEYLPEAPMMYDLAGSYEADDSEFEFNIPKARDIGTYYVYFKISESCPEYYRLPTIGLYIRVVIDKASAEVTTDPVGATPVYDGSDLALLSVEGAATGGAIMYAVSESPSTQPGLGDFSTDVPKRAEVGEYYVWYYVKGNSDHTDGAVSKIKVTISKGVPTYSTPADLTAEEGQTLSDIALPQGWAWKDGSLSVGNAGRNTFKASYTPNDTAHYAVVENIDVEVKVTAPEPDPVITTPDPEPEPTPIYYPEPVVEKKEEPKPSIFTRENKDGSVTTIEIIWNADGTTTVINQVKQADGALERKEETRDSKGNGTLKIEKKDALGNLLSSTEGTIAVNKKGTETIKSTTVNSDGSKEEKTQKTYKRDPAADNVKKVTINVKKTDVAGNTEVIKTTAFVGVLGDATVTEKSEFTLAAAGGNGADEDAAGSDSKSGKSEEGSEGKNKTDTGKDGSKTAGNVVKEERQYSLSVNGRLKLLALTSDGEKVMIPESIELDGMKRVVKSIGKNALKGNKTVKSVEIGENITTICSGAFKNCKNLELVELTGSIKTIYKNAFKGIAKNAKFVIKASEEDFARIVELIKKSGVDESVTFERAE